MPEIEVGTVGDDRVLAELELRGPAATAQLVEAISAPPELSRTIDGATTLTVDVRDQDRELLRSGMFDTRSWAVLDGLNFELVAVDKVTDNLALTFEDAVVAAFRRRNEPRSFAAGSSTRQGIAAALAGEAQVPILADPQQRAVVSAAVERSADGQEPSTSWEVLGSLAEAIGWRRYSDGYQLLFGSDDWLMTLLEAVDLREHVDAAGNIDFNLDVGKPASTATVTVDTTRWSIPPGQPVNLLDLGPGSGRWLCKSFTRKLTRTTAKVELVRGQASLEEPAPDDAAFGDQGMVDFLPTAPTATTAGTGLSAIGTQLLNLIGGPKPSSVGYRGPVQNRRPSSSVGFTGPVQGAPGVGSSGSSGAGSFATGNAALERFLTYALAQRGKRYVWGASGPQTFDCSGLVQEATRAAGKLLSKPSANQWATVQLAGKTISVQQALRTRGALLFRINAPPGNHIAISLGDGTTMEARSTADGVNVFPNAGRFVWTGGALWV